MEWSSETYWFFHYEIVTVLSKKPTGLNSAFPNFAALVQIGSLVLCFSSLSAFPSPSLWKQSPPVWDLNAQFGDLVLRTLTWTVQSWCEITGILGPAGSDILKWHQGLLPSDLSTKTWGKNREDWKGLRNLGIGASTFQSFLQFTSSMTLSWSCSSSVTLFSQLIHKSIRKLEYLTGSVIHKITLVGFQSHQEHSDLQKTWKASRNNVSAQYINLHVFLWWCDRPGRSWVK